MWLRRRHEVLGELRRLGVIPRRGKRFDPRLEDPNALAALVKRAGTLQAVGVELGRSVRMVHRWLKRHRIPGPGLPDSDCRLGDPHWLRAHYVVVTGLTDGTEYVQNVISVSFVEDTPCWGEQMNPFMAVWPAALQAEAEAL